MYNFKDFILHIFFVKDVYVEESEIKNICSVQYAYILLLLEG